MVALMESGDLFGEMGLFDGKGRSAQARALEDSVVTAIPYEPVRSLYESNPIFLWQVMKCWPGGCEIWTRRSLILFSLMSLDVGKKLLELAGKVKIFFTYPQEELAGMVGASRERVNKAIAAFVRLGWIEQMDRSYRIINREQLMIRSK